MLSFKSRTFRTASPLPTTMKPWRKASTAPWSISLPRFNAKLPRHGARLTSFDTKGISHERPSFPQGHGGAQPRQARLESFSCAAGSAGHSKGEAESTADFRLAKSGNNRRETDLRMVDQMAGR